MLSKINPVAPNEFKTAVGLDSECPNKITVTINAALVTGTSAPTTMA